MADKEKSRKKRVMVAIDGSECSHYALKWTLDYLKDTIADSDIILFTAQPPFDQNLVDDVCASYGAEPTGLIDSMKENRKKAGLRLLDLAAEICAEIGITPRKVMELGSPKEEICDAVMKHRVDLLVVGSHGKGETQRAFLGSVSNYCVNKAKCPVLVVRMKD